MFALCDNVRVLGVTFSSNLSLDKHVSSVMAKCFCWLCQLQKVCRSLAIDSLKTLVHSFVMSRVDYWNAVPAGSSQYITDTLQRVLNAAAHLVSGTRIFDQSLSSSAWRTALVRCSWASAVQTGWQWRFRPTFAFKTKHRGTWSTTAWSQSPMSPVDNIWDLPVDAFWLFRGFNEIHQAVGPIGVWRFGSHYRTIRVICRTTTV